MAEKTPLFQYVHHVHYVVHNLDDVMAYMEQHFNMKADHMFEDKSRGMRDALYDVGQTHYRARP